jgi:hypothetical protein
MEQTKSLFTSDKEIRDGMDVRLAAHAFEEAAAVFMARYVDKTEKNLTADCGDGVVLQVKNDVSPEEFEAYASEELASNPDAHISEIAGNRFVSVPLTEGYRYASYFPARHQARMLSAQVGELMPSQLGEKEHYSGPKTITQIAPNDEAKNFGMCYVFSLGEGHFLIYDGLGDRGGDEEKIYETMRAVTPEGQKPVVDAWILTHPHFDHTAGVYKFATRYASDVSVKNFVMNMAAGHRFNMKLWYEISANYACWIAGTLRAFPEAKVWKAHTGQSFSVGDARVEVLYTQEEFHGVEMPVNDTSLVTRVFLSGKSLIFPADISGAEECQWIHDIYGSYLKSDYYQLAHHAWDTDVLRFYYDIDPMHMLWPLRARDWDRETMWTFPATKVYVEEMNAGKRIFHIARGENITLPL